jgi:hypothetical protein
MGAVLAFVAFVVWLAINEAKRAERHGVQRDVSNQTNEALRKHAERMSRAPLSGTEVVKRLRARLARRRNERVRDDADQSS